MKSQEAESQVCASTRQEYHRATEQSDHASRMTEILNQPLRPDTIGGYAEQALTKLIDLVAEITDDYDARPTLRFEQAKQHEDAALGYFSLSTLEQTLDHVADIAGSISELDNLIKAAPTQLRSVIIPTDKRSLQLYEGGEGREYVPAQYIPRLKTLLFILQQDFDLDPSRPDDVAIQVGVVEKDTVRRQSYYSVVVPKLDRAIFISDEEENATFFYDTSKLEAVGLTLESLSAMTKSQQNELMQVTPGIGRRITYSNQFMEDMKRYLAGELTSAAPDHDSPKPTNYLYPKAPGGYTAMTKLAQEFGVSRGQLELAVEFLAGELGEIGQYRFMSIVAPAYSPQQQELLRGRLEEEGVLGSTDALDAPDGYLNKHTLRIKLDVPVSAISYAISALTDILGEVSRYRFTPIYTLGYSPQQQALIERYIAEEMPEPPEGCINSTQLAQRLGVDYKRLHMIVDTTSVTLGELNKYRFPYGMMIGYSRQQQALIEKSYEALGGPIETAPEGYLAAYGIARFLKTNSVAVAEAIESVGDQIGTSATYKFGHTPAIGYSPEQQAIIIEQLRATGKLYDPAPESYLSPILIAKQWNVHKGTVEAAMKKMGDTLGDVGYYKSSQSTGMPKPYLSPEQQQIIHDQLQREGAFIPLAPEGFLTINGVRQSLNVSHVIVARAVERLGDSLGTLAEYRFGSRVYPCYSPEQIAVIARYITRQ